MAWFWADLLTCLCASGDRQLVYRRWLDVLHDRAFLRHGLRILHVSIDHMARTFLLAHFPALLGYQLHIIFRCSCPARCCSLAQICGFSGISAAFAVVMKQRYGERVLWHVQTFDVCVKVRHPFSMFRNKKISFGQNLLHRYVLAYTDGAVRYFHHLLVFRRTGQRCLQYPIWHILRLAVPEVRFTRCYL